MVGNKDPLHDESWRFLKKLEYINFFYMLFYFFVYLIIYIYMYSDLNKDVKMYVYSEMPHGFLNYDAPSGMKEAK
jgi:hormone-sensitive lipase